MEKRQKRISRIFGMFRSVSFHQQESSPKILMRKNSTNNFSYTENDIEKEPIDHSITHNWSRCVPYMDAGSITPEIITSWRNELANNQALESYLMSKN